MSSPSTCTLVTGFPERRLARHLVQTLARDEKQYVCCLVLESHLQRAEQFVERLPAAARRRISLLQGDPKAIDLGLSGEEFTKLSQDVRVIHHCAAVTDPAGTREDARGNVQATAEVLELAEGAADLDRLVCWFSTAVSGKREGFVREDELSSDAGFRSVIEESLFASERMVREVGERLPVLILRPALVVGHPLDEAEELHGPYLLLRFLLSTPEDFRIPAPSRGSVRISTVPVDYVVRAGLCIANDERALGKTFHIVDPKPVTVQHAFELFAQATGRPSPKEPGPLGLAASLMLAPGQQRLTHTTRAFLDHLRTDVIYDDSNTRALLHDASITCPALEDYVDAMVEEARKAMEAEAPRA